MQDRCTRRRSSNINCRLRPWARLGQVFILATRLLRGRYRTPRAVQQGGTWRYGRYRTPTLHSHFPIAFSAFCHSHGHCGSGKLKLGTIMYQNNTVKIKPGFAVFLSLLSLRRALCAAGFSLRTGPVLWTQHGAIGFAALSQPERPVPSSHQ